MKSAGYIPALILLSLFSVNANPKEIRMHYKVIDASHAIIYDAVVISTLTPENSSETYLLRNNKTGSRLRIQVDRDARKHETTAEYTVDGHSPAKVRLQLPAAAPTLRGSAEEYRSRPELRSADIPVQIQSVAGVIETSEKQWTANMDDVRGKAKKKIDPTVTETVRAMLPALGFPALAGACATVPFVADGQACRIDVKLAIGSGPDDCTFDKEFCIPCRSTK